MTLSWLFLLLASAPSAGVDPLSVSVNSTDARRFAAVFEASDGTPSAATDAP